MIKGGRLALIPIVGASLLAKNSQAPRSFRKHALSLTFFASKLAPTEGTFVPGSAQDAGRLQGRRAFAFDLRRPVNGRY
ncbi:hypothetical protein PspCFBP13528_25815 [Pseudomonas sp. CFBP13528]|uniref:Uncharacterized protein n=1 Tax=Pseudomonas fluorescens TaxID=294 RepID=A0A2N1EE37_PSEFL|nr:hypothetical protein CIB54_03500 [Pseudomonas fluorescens]TKK25722.1 hypothetical protein PspCFBP13528_25815 [Pseudomonas sp. CFBP13528]